MRVLLSSLPYLNLASFRDIIHSHPFFFLSLSDLDDLIPMGPQSSSISAALCVDNGKAMKQSDVTFVPQYGCSDPKQVLWTEG